MEFSSTFIFFANKCADIGFEYFFLEFLILFINKNRKCVCRFPKLNLFWFDFIIVKKLN